MSNVEDEEEREGVMSVDWDEHFMSSGGAVTAKKKKKVKKCKSFVKHDDLHPTPQISKALVSIPPNRRSKVCHFLLQLNCYRAGLLPW